MAELILLSAPWSEVMAAHRRVARGDSDALQYFRNLWTDYADRALACFLCDAECETPPFSMLLPEREPGAADALVAPLCAGCAALPRMVQMNRAIRLLRRMGWRIRRDGFR